MMSESKSETDRKFLEIVRPQSDPGMSVTLSNMLASCTNHTISSSAIDYVMKRLWTPTPDPRS